MFPVLKQVGAKEMEGMRVRQARHSDYAAVMDINKEVFGGMDYMHSMYHYFIEHAHCYVALIHNTVAGFVCYYPMDGGRRAVSMGGRTAKQFQGQRLVPHLSALIMPDLLQRCPHMERLSWSSTDMDTRTRRALDPRYGIIPARTWDYLMYQVPWPDTDLSKKLSTLSFSNIKKLDKTGIHSLSTATMDTLFGGYPYIEALFNWFPLSVSKQSLEWIEREGHLAVSLPSTPGGSTEYNMLSHSNMVRTFSGVCLRIHLRHHQADMHTKLQHLLYHLHTCAQRAPPGILGLIIDLGVVGDLEEMIGLLRGYLGQPYEQGQGMSGDNLLVVPDTTSKL